jgi:alcohol dehydrogenase
VGGFLIPPLEDADVAIHDELSEEGGRVGPCLRSLHARSEVAVILTARLFSPAQIVAIDVADSRLDAAKQFGAGVVVNSGREEPVEMVKEITEGLGSDVTVEAVGVPETFELCTRLVRPGGRVANVGVHGKPATLHLEDLWIKDVTITTGLVDTYSTPTLLRLIRSGQLNVAGFVTHRFPLDEFPDAYDTFSRAGETGALKVVLSRA